LLVYSVQLYYNARCKITKFVNKNVAYRKMLTDTNDEQVRNGVVRYFDEVQCKWFTNIKEMKIIVIRTKW